MIVDDHPIVIQGLGELINGEEDMEVCGHAENVESALEAMARETPDVAIVDLSLGEADGLRVIKACGVLHPAIPMLVYSMHHESLRAQEVMAAGARGYVMKQCPSQTLLAALRQVLGGGTWVSERVAEQMAAAGAAAPRGREAPAARKGGVHLARFRKS